jgi:hypothetical protein
VTGDAEDTRLRVEVRRGNPSPDELAAVVAVVSAGYTQESEEARVEEKRRSAWELSRRGMRTPLRRDIGWGRFGG